ncbi:MAG TPA: glycine--tRNA ligase subunit beta [Xanthomonadaceae bacterium]|nr:glycine--tRNA ligase subunit beta [Xanthomonadaceae bacterium]
MAAAHASLLLEIGTEELPVKALPELARSLCEGVLAGLARRGIAHDASAARALYTPRRLAVYVPAVALAQPEQRSERRGPALAAGRDAQGEPTRALLGFAQGCGVAVQDLETVQTDKGAWYVHRAVKAGERTAALLPQILLEAVAAMPIPRPMRWGAREAGFARPVHWLVLLLGEEVVEADLFGLRADRMSRGHRFHHPGPVWISDADGYVDALRGAHVLVDPDERRERIRAGVEAAAGAAGSARITAENLEQVNGLVEWPVAIACDFDRDYLQVPAEALVSTMEANQKFFPVLDADGRLSARFVGVANLESRDPDQVRRGYERVIRPRFADARFFFDEDLRQGLESMQGGLASVTYQARLGSYADKVERVEALVERVAPHTGADPAQARRAAALSRADLMSRLVGEFPELQGIAGRYYADAAGEDDEVAIAIDEAYRPRYAGDAIAATPTGRALAIAERLDTLAGGFAAGLKPSGNKDPFALRRSGLGLARTLIEGAVDLDLPTHLELAVEALAPAAWATPSGAVDPAVGDLRSERMRMAAELYDFVLDRLRGYYGDQGVPVERFEAVASVRPASLYDFDRRLRALGEFVKLPEAEALAAANKRIRNILRKAGEPVPDRVETGLLTEEAERALQAAVLAAEADTAAALASRDYVAVLSRLAQLKPVVDAFFDHVMVMAEDAAVRGNRLALLRRLSDRFLAIADISQLSVA